jgi:hypothetical protein
MLSRAEFPLNLPPSGAFIGIIAAITVSTGAARCRS